MKKALTLIAITAASLTAWSQTKTPQEISAEISNAETAIYTTMQRAVDAESKDPHISQGQKMADQTAAYIKAQEQVRRAANKALHGVNPAKIDPKDAYTWAQLFSRAGNERVACRLATYYLTSNPSPDEKLKGQLLLINSANDLGDAETLKEALVSTKPVGNGNDAMDYYSLAPYFVDSIAAKEGAPEGLKTLDFIQDRMQLPDPHEKALDRFTYEKKHPKAGAKSSLSDDQLVKQYEEWYKHQNESVVQYFVSERVKLLSEEGKDDEALMALRELAKTRPELLNPSLKPFEQAAPQFKVGKWLKGQPIDGLEKGKVYVVDFWGTKCGPCIEAFPHLKAMQKKFEGKVEFVGLCVVRWSPTVPYPDTPKQRVSFVRKRGGEMVDRVVEDTEDGYMVTNWLTPTGDTQIPRLFIVDSTGKIAWYGEPDFLELALDKYFDKVAAN